MRKILMAAATLIALTGAASAQDWPNRPITLIVPFAAGGGIDASARIQAQRMGELLGQTIVVENVGAVAGQVGSARVAKAPPDGYTVLDREFRHARLQPSALQEADVQLDNRIPAGRLDDGIAAYPDRAQGSAGEQFQGIRRLCESEPEQDAVQLGRRRLGHAFALRALEHGNGRQRHARALSRGRSGACRT